MDLLPYPLWKDEAQIKCTIVIVLKFIMVESVSVVIMSHFSVHSFLSVSHIYYIIMSLSSPPLHQVCHANPSERARFIRCIYNLLQSSSPAVKYEAAGTLVTLSSAPTAIKVHKHTSSLSLKANRTGKGCSVMSWVCMYSMYSSMNYSLNYY